MGQIQPRLVGQNQWVKFNWVKMHPPLVANVSVSVFTLSGGDLLSMGAGKLYGSTWGWVDGCTCT